MTYNEINQVLNTLPIGYYCGRRVNVSLDKDAEMSGFNLFEDKIVISYPQVEAALGDLEVNETTVRTALYHELSHAILTPLCMAPTPERNIFEDERIETILDGYYYDTDFKRTKYLINGEEPGNVSEPQNAIQAFYHLVRYRIGEEKWLRRVENIIKKNASLDRESSRYATRLYCEAIDQLYEDFKQEFYKKNPEKVQNEKNGLGSKGDKHIAGKPQSAAAGEKEGIESGNGECQGDVDVEGDPFHGRMSDAKFRSVQSKFRKTIAELHLDCEKSIETIINNFHKKTNSGNGTTGYSGVFNPRRAGDEDYRFFDRAIAAVGSNKFGSCHLNLFIDRSGSFRDDQNKVNALIKILTHIEKANPNFSLDICTIGMTNKLAETIQERELCCGGGNDIPHDIFDIWRKLQKPNTLNYNIVLFDGDAFSDGNEYKNFSAFNHSNCTIVTDRDNKRYADRYINAARVVYTEEYVKDFEENIIAALQRAFN